MQQNQASLALARAAVLAVAVSLGLWALKAAASDEALFAAVPISDLGAGTYLGFEGGLYPGGTNVPPPDHLAAGLAHAANVVPRDTFGNPSPTGKIVLVSIGMSNTTQEFCNPVNPAPCNSWTFVGQATADAAVNHSTLALINGARGGQSAATWVSSTMPNYDLVRNNDLFPAGLKEAQVQVGWVKVANPGPTVSLPDASADAYTLETQMGQIVRSMRIRYPNLQLVYFASRIYAGYAVTNLNPEPYAYESGFAVKWLVQAQIDQRHGDFSDHRAGDLSDAVAPWIGWGAYLWASGTTPRSDGLTWPPADLSSDGTHPSVAGQQQVGSLLLNFFKTDATSQPWFLAFQAGPLPPMANFDYGPAMPRATQAPRVFRFTDSSTGNPDSWSWSFGDGTTSSVQNPIHRYTAAGDFTVTLTVSNAGGSNTATHTVTVERCPDCPTVVPFR